MAGIIVVDSVRSSSTGAPTFQNTSGTEIGTLCRAWVTFNGTNGAIASSFNVSSVTRTGVGAYTITFTNAMPDALYSVAGCNNDIFGYGCYITITSRATGSAGIGNYGGSGARDVSLVTVNFFR